MCGGGDLYEVRVELKNGVAELDCTCPYARREGEPCKHLWATLLTAEDAGAFRDVRRIVRVVLPEPDEVDLEDEDSSFEFELEFEDDDSFDEDVDDTGIVATSREELARELAELFGDDDLDAAPGPPPWQSLVPDEARGLDSARPARRTQKELLYGIVLFTVRDHVYTGVRLGSRDHRGAVEWSIKPSHGARWVEGDIDLLRRIDALAEESRPSFSYGYSYGHYGREWFHKWSSEWILKDEAARLLLPRICATGRAVGRWGTARSPFIGTVNARFGSSFGSSPPRGGYRVGAFLHRARDDGRDDEIIEASAIGFVTGDGIVGVGTRFLCLHDASLARFLQAIREFGEVRVPRDEAHEFRTQLLSLRDPPIVHLPEDLAPEERSVPPVAELVVESASSQRLVGRAMFRYEQRRIDANDPRSSVFDADAIVVYQRDVAAESDALKRFDELCPEPSARPIPFDVPREELPRIVTALKDAGWQVVADAKRIRAPGEFSIDVVSAIDWFDVRGRQRFDDRELPLPELLRALRAGEDLVLLDDGTYGMVPESWLKSRRLLLEMGEASDEGIRFSANQAVWIDLLLEAEASENRRRRNASSARASGSAARLRCRQRTRGRPGSTASSARYQREGVAWLGYLRAVGFGGCLADDMGLGKTVQTLAHVAATRSDGGKPVLVVAPRSLVHNWADEAARFTSSLRVVTYTGTAARRSATSSARRTSC